MRVRSEYPGRLLAELTEHVAGADLASRGRDVLRSLVSGNTNKETVPLSIAEETLKSHITNMMSKLRANDRTRSLEARNYRAHVP